METNTVLTEVFNVGASFGLVGGLIGLCAEGASAAIPYAVIFSATALTVKAIDILQKEYAPDTQVKLTLSNWKADLFDCLKGVAVLTGLAVAHLALGIFSTMTIYVIAGISVAWILISACASIQVYHTQKDYCTNYLKGIEALTLNAVSNLSLEEKDVQAMKVFVFTSESNNQGRLLKAHIDPKSISDSIKNLKISEIDLKKTDSQDYPEIGISFWSTVVVDQKGVYHLIYRNEQNGKLEESKISGDRNTIHEKLVKLSSSQNADDVLEAI